MSKNKKGNDVDGILLLDKPFGRSSNSALQKIRYLFNAKKAGHTGSLDPLATGVLPICFGQASKVSAYLLDSDKRYIFTAQLGETTTTGDKEGDVLQTRDVTPFTAQQLETVLEKFRGEIEQIPPMHSALKHNGQPLYKLARQGIEIERKVRKVTIHELRLLDKTADTITVEAKCSKGTYIRTLAQDIGEALGFGAHLSLLRRTEVSPFDCSKLYTIEDIEALSENLSKNNTESSELEATLLPIDSALVKLPSMILTNAESDRVKTGLKISRNDIPESDMIKMYLENGEFIGIGRCSYNEHGENQLAPKRMMKTN